MKTEIQAIDFIKTSIYKTSQHYECISTLFKSKFGYEPETIPMTSPDGITTDDYVTWFESGYGIGDVVMIEGKIALLGRCLSYCVMPIAYLMGDELQILHNFHNIDTNDVSPASKKDEERMRLIVASNGYQISNKTLHLAAKYIPSPRERIEFYNETEKCSGVVRTVDKESGIITLYCSFNYTTGDVAYNEETLKPIKIVDYTFREMSRSSLRRLNSELGKKGKIWHDKICRVEPLNMKASIGAKYWFIDDKLRLRQDVEMGRPTSHARLLAGNYFTVYEDGLDMLETIFYFRDGQLCK